MALDQSNVFVKYLPPELNDAGLHNLFSPFGEIVSSKVMVDHQTGASLGYGFVRFVEPSDAQNAIASMTGQRVSNKTLLCKLSNSSPNSGTPEPSNNLYIKPLLPTTTEEDLRGLFDKFGPINTCKVMVDKVTGQSRQIGFVRFENIKDATSAMQKMNGYKLDDEATPLVVKYAENENQRATRKARAHQNSWGRNSSDRIERPPSPNVFNFSAMQTALYGMPYVSTKGGYMPYLPTLGYQYVMPLSPHQVQVSPLWRPPYVMNTNELVNAAEIGQH
jgi:RNA recognition motif-containing protein